MTATVERPKSKLFQSNSLFAQDDLEEKLEKCRKVVEDLIKDTSEKQAHDALSAAVSKSPQLHEEVCLGLLHVVLTEPKSAQNAYRDLNLVARDSMLLVVNKLLQVIAEKYIRLLDAPKVQLLWLTMQLVQSNIGGADAICHALLKQGAGGDLSVTNVWLADTLLNLFTKNRQWLEKFPLLLATTVFSYLRLIEDHSSGAYKLLRQREVNFCVLLLRERFADCMQIGRDLVRLLQNLSKIPEVKSLWKDLLHKPQTLSPQFSGISQLLSVRTSRKFLGSRLTPDMENKIGFLTSKVKFGQQKRYQEWFQKQYLTLPESQSLRADLIRYICGVVHPSNEILGSDITPRWAVIGWLLSTCPNNITAANAKLALFYDWLFYQVDIDNIMNIEPGILVMYHSLRSHFQITTSLLDFLCRVSLEYYQQEQSSRECVRNAFKTVLEKKVIMSLIPIIENPRMGQELKTLVRTTFPEFFPTNGSSVSGKLPEEPRGKMDSFGSDSSGILNFGGVSGPDTVSDSDSADGVNDAKFSDTDEEMESHVNGEKSIVKVRDGKFRPIVPEKSIEEKNEDDDENGDMVDFDELEKLDEDLRDLVLKLQQESNPGTRCDTMESIIALVISLSDFDEEMNNALATCLNISLVEDYYRPCLPEKVTGRELEDSLESPLYTLLGKLIHLPVHDIGREIIMKLLLEMKAREPKLAYHLLYYLRASDEENLTVYEEFVKSTKDFKSIPESLLDDMKTCRAYDPRLFFYIVPALYRTFPKFLVGNGDMLHLMVSIVDPVQLKELLHEVVLRDLVIFGEENVDEVLKGSLLWESYEQYNVWQLLCAEDPPVESFLNVLPLLKPSVHAEAMSNVLLLLKGAELTSEIVSTLLCMECPSALKEKPKLQLSTCLLRYWSFDYGKELAKIICSHIEKNLSTGNRRRQSKATQLQPTMEQILVQLKCFYEVCQFHQNLDFFKQEIVKRCLEKVKQNCTDSVQKKFHLLFSVCEEQDSRRRNNRMSKIVATQLAEEGSTSESGEEEEEEEEEEPPSKKRTGKRKRKLSPDLYSDSDE